MPVTREDVLRVAGLARLRLSEEEIERLTSELNGILAHVAELAEADASGAAAPGGAAEGEAPLRSEDSPADRLLHPPEEIAPAWEDGFYTLPRLAAMDAADDAAAEGGG